MKLSAILLGAALVAVPVSAFADSPRAFLGKALEADNAEIMLGRMAQDRAVSPDVRDFGRTLETDHIQARNDVLNVGRRFGLRPDRDVGFDARQLRDRLDAMRGRDFDREFVTAMIQDHRKDIADFRDETQEPHGPVSDLAARQLPTLQKHLDIAMDLDRRLDRGPAYGYRDRDRDRDQDNDWYRNRSEYGFRSGRWP